MIAPLVSVAWYHQGQVINRYSLDVWSDCLMRNRPATLRFLLDNLGWILVSLILAVMVWFAAVSAQNPVEQRRLAARLPIRMTTPEGLMIVNEPPDTAFVTIRAPRSVWDVLVADDVNVTADLSNKVPGMYTIPLQAALSSTRRGQITDIQPSQSTVELARRLEQLVNVELIRTAEAPSGFTTASYTLSDNQARVVGPENQVKKVALAQARVSLQDQRRPFSQTVRLIPVDADNKEVPGVTLVPAEVTVNIDIQLRRDATQLTIVPRLTGELPTGYFRRNYTVDPQTVVVRGDQATIDNLNGSISTDPVDLTGKTQTFTQKVKLALPAGVTLPEPVDITVTVEIEPVLGSREFNDIPVQTQGLDPADYIITIQPERVTVIVNGPQAALDQLTPADINVIAPLTGLAPGNKYPVTLRASVAKGGIESRDIVIPNPRAEVTIAARRPTASPTAAPTRTPLATGTAEAAAMP